MEDSKNWEDEFRSYRKFDEQVRDIEASHMINLRVRINGEWKEYQADWLKSLVNQVFKKEA